MKAIVVYESHWGNTAAIARAIAEGIGPGARAFSTAEATREAIADSALIVAGAPVLGFRLPDERMMESIRSNPVYARTGPDLAHPTMKTWLAGLPKGHGIGAAFETRLWWSLGGSTAAITRSLETAGYRQVLKAARFIVKGTYGPLREGELDRARGWGAELARACQAAPGFAQAG